MKTDRQSIYEIIKEKAQLKHISIRQLEHTFGFSNGTISKWDESAPVFKLNQVANYLNTSIDNLIGNYVKYDYPIMMLAKKINNLSDDDISLVNKLVDRLNR